MNFQVTVLKILVSYPDGFATMEDLKRDMVILATSGRDWSDRTRRLGAGVPGLDIFSQALVARISGGWRITDEGRAVLDLMERLSAESPSAADVAPEVGPARRLPLGLRAERGRELSRRRRLREAHTRPRARAS